MDDSEKNTSERDDEVFKDSFKNARKEIKQRGLDYSLYRDFPDCNGLKHWTVWYNGKTTGTRFVEYRDKFVTTTGLTYELLPNEKAINLVEETLLENKSWGLQPDQSHSEGNWHVQNGNVVMSKEKANCPTGTSMAARYRFPDNIDPTGDGRELHLGICIVNSIDKTRGFSVIPYHYRSGCLNSMYHVMAVNYTKAGEITWSKNGTVDWNDNDLVSMQGNVNREIEHLNVVTEELKSQTRGMRHSKKLLDKDFVKEQIVSSIETVGTMGQRYKELAKGKLLKKTVEVIANSNLPKVVWNHLEGVTVTAEKDAKGNETGRNLAEITKPKTNWEMYNQVTNILSHGNLDFNSTLKHMGTLDSIFRVWQ